MEKIQKPKKSSLISNLLNRVDGKSLAIKKNTGAGVVYYLESENQKHLKANKDSLQILEYFELEVLISGEKLIRESFTMAMFNLVEHTAPPKIQPKPLGFHVKGIKEVDRVGSNKFAEPTSKDQKPSGGFKKKSPRKRI